MVTQAQILSRSGNKCTVRIPVFEQAGLNTVASAEAAIMLPPGMYNTYQVNDMVIVAFDRDLFNMPVILGKICQDTISDEATGAATINCTNLAVTNKASLPADTELVYAKNNLVAGSASTYKSITNIIESIQKLQQQIESGGSISSASQQPYFAYAKDATTNIMGYNLENLGFSDRTLESESIIQIICNDKEQLTVGQIKQYMEYMTGVATDLTNLDPNKYQGMIIFGNTNYYAKNENNKLFLIPLS